MAWLYIVGVSAGFLMGLYVGRRLGIQEVHRALHVLSGKKAVNAFYKNTGLGRDRHE